MTTENQLTIEQRERLSSNLGLLLPRVDAITSEFCHLVELSDPNLRLMIPSDERTVSTAIEHLLRCVQSNDDGVRLAQRFAQLGPVAGIGAHHLPTLLAAIQTAIAETAGYTWTDQLEHDWTCWFDTMTETALRHAERDDSLAA